VRLGGVRPGFKSRRPHHCDFVYFMRGGMLKLTKFEIARILGARSLQISNGAYATIETECDSSLKIAHEEIRQKKVPLKPIRPVKA